MNFSINIIDNINNNSGTVTVTRSVPYILTTTTKNGGHAGEQKIYNITGSTTSTTQLTVATIKIEASTSKEFVQAPSLSSTNNIRLILSNIEQETTSSGRKYISAYLFNIVYYNTISVGTQDNITANLSYNDYIIPTRENKITRLTFGKSILNRNGGKRKITIIGAPNSTATLTIKDDNGDSILSAPNTTVENNFGQTISALSLTIGSNGTYSFDQEFPSVISRKTAVNGSMAASGTDKIIFDNLSGVKVGDKVIVQASPDETSSILVTVLDPDIDNENECTVAPNLTAADNALIYFKISRTYDINIETSSGLGSNIPTTSPTYTIYQYKDPVLTIKVSTAESLFAISHFNDVATSFADGVDHEVKYAGIANASSKETERDSNIKKTIDFSYTLDLAGVHTFTAFTTPIFDKKKNAEFGDDGTHIGGSHWTNSIPSENGGTDINIGSIGIGALSANTLKISGTIIINKWGTEDVAMELDLDKILTHSR